MKNYLMIFILINISCNRGNTSGVIPQFKFASPEFDRISTYYVYDYVAKNHLIEYSQKEDYTIGRTSLHYYYSHNANIPSNDLRQLETMSEIKKTMKVYAHSLKYVFIKNSNGEEQFVNCLLNPQDSLCLFD